MVDMKIAIDARMYGNQECSGIGTYIEELTKHLFLIDQHNQYLLFLKEPYFSSLKTPENVLKILANDRWYTYAEQFKFPWTLMANDFDLIHFPHFNSPILFRKKSVCTIHDITPFHYPGHKMSSGWRQVAYRAVFRKTVNSASQIITISQSTKQGIIKNFRVNPEKINITYEGVDERFKKCSNYAIIKEILNKYGITKKYIFFVGVWRSHKNIESLIKAFNLIKQLQTNKELQLVLGGREDLHYTKIRQEINNSPFKGDIIATGFIKDQDLPVLYSAAECFTIPSFIEGFGLVTIEAQSCGTPVASSNLTSLPEVLGDSAIYFDPHDIKQMADVLNNLVNDEKLKSSLTEKGYQNIKRFSWRNCAEKTLQIYNNSVK